MLIKLKTLVFLVVGMCLTSHSLADSVYFPSDKNRDSLLNLLKTAEKEQLVDVLNSLSLYYNISDPPQAMLYIQQAEQLAGDLNYQAGLAFAIKEEGMMMLNKGEILAALTLLEKARSISVAIDDKNLIGRTLHCIGLVYSHFGFLDYSLKYFEDAISAYREAGQLQMIAYCLYDEASVYSQNKEFQRALEKIRQCDDFSLTNKINIEGGPSHILLGDIFAGLNEDTLALENYRVGLVQIEKEKLSDRMKGWGLRSLGKFYLSKGLYDEAKRRFDQARQIADKGTNKIEKGEILLDIAMTGLHQGRLSTALKSAEEALAVVKDSHAITFQAKVLFTRAEILEALGQEGPALRDISRAYQLQDSVNSVGHENYIADMVASFEAEKAELEIRSLNNQLEATKGELENTSTLSHYYLGAAVLFIAIIIFVTYNQRKQKLLTKKLYTVNKQISVQNAELKTLNSEKSELIKLVAHDMRSPVNNIVSIAGLLKRDNITEAEQKEYVRLIESICKKIDNSISKFLGSRSNTEQGQKQPQLELISVNGLLKETASQFAAKAASKGIHLTFVPEKTNPQIFTDIDYVSQVVSNLLSNAVKFCSAGNTIQVQVENGLEYLSIVVADDGPGVSPEEQPAIFDQYVTTSNRTTANETSTGLGLAIAKRLTEALGGTIELESDAGKGCKFTVRLPQTQNAYEGDEQAFMKSV